jgi:uncharacterized membrane protein YqjE
LELALTELEEEREREKRIVLLTVLLVCCLTFGLGLLIFFVLVVLGGSYWVYALGGLALLHLLLALFVGVALRRNSRVSPELFPATRSELRKDIDLLKPKV